MKKVLLCRRPSLARLNRDLAAPVADLRPAPSALPRTLSWSALAAALTLAPEAVALAVPA